LSLINTTVGNYNVTQLLGEGGMGMVYLGEHPVIGRKVAIKVLHSALARDTDIVARFFNEARAIHMIGHANIVEILDFGQTPDGQPYFIMEYLTGEALSERVARGPMPADEVAVIVDQMCRALAAAHTKGIVHRDLKPHNVQLLEKDGEVLVKILDFGVAKILAAPDGSQSVKTRTGSLMGTPLYMSPEQCKGAGLLDHRTDIYSLGVMIFEMLAGRPPFMAEGIGELFAKHMLEEAPPIAELAPATPPAMAAAVMKALNKELEDRFQSMEEFRQGLLGEIHIEGSGQVTGPGAKRLGATRARPGQHTISPQAQSTTLSSATSAIDDALTPPRSKTGLLVGVAGAVAAMIIGAVVVLPKLNKKADGKSTASAARLVTLRFEATPGGAHVFRKNDGTDLGSAPLEVRLPQKNDAMAYLLHKDGYKDAEVIAELSQDRTLTAALEKLPEPEPAPVAPPTPPPDKSPPPQAEAAHKKPSGGPKHVSSKHAKTPVPDEDGLATPSF
jgi:serine/threonine protein kinase